MWRDNSFSYPKSGERISTWRKDSKYLIQIISPKEICVAFNKYASDYNYAARKVASRLLESNNISQLDTYIFPLTFLYRHSIELKLKAIVFQTLNIHQDRSSFVKDTRHNLEKMLNALECISSYTRPVEEVVWLRDYFTDISKIDKESDSFRYPFHIRRNRLFDGMQFTIERIFEKQTHIDLLKFTNKFEAAYEILDKWYKKSPDESLIWKGLKPVFIEEGGLYYGQSVVYSRDDFYPYTSAYLETANYLRQFMKEQLESGNGDRVSGLFMPMCYLYRNCVELNLKTIWFEETDEDFQNRCKKLVARKHSIRGMWNLIKPFVKDYATGSEDIEYIKILEDYCYQLHDIDNDSSKFRYPVKKDMIPYFNKNTQFDLMLTGIFLESLNNGLSSICASFSVMNAYKAEMEYEYRLIMQSNYDYY